MQSSAEILSPASPRRAQDAQPQVLHLLLPAAPLTSPALTLRPRAWSQDWRRSVHGSDAAVWACRAAIDATPHLQHRVCILGGNAAGERAAAMGLPAHCRIAPPFARPELAAAGVTNLIREHDQPDIIQCWGADFAPLRDRLCVGTPNATWMVLDMHTGVLATRDCTTPKDPLTQALTPWLPVPRALTERDREDVRAQLGVDDDSLLVALVGDPPSTVDAVAALYALSILHVAGIRATAVFPRTTGRIDRALRHIASGGYLHSFRLIDEPISTIAPGCDLGLCIPLPVSESEVLCEPGFSTKLALSRAAGQGLPVIMPSTPWAQWTLPQSAAACLSPSADHADLAKRIFALLDDDRRPLRACRAALIEHCVRAPSRGLTDELSAAWTKVLSRSTRR